MEYTKNTEYFLLDGTVVVLDDYMVCSDGTFKFLVRPKFAGETIGISGEGGYHHEFNIEYEEYGSQTIVDKIFDSYRKTKFFTEKEELLKETIALKKECQQLSKEKTLLTKDLEELKQLYIDFDNDKKLHTELIQKVTTLGKKLQELEKEITIKTEANSIIADQKKIKYLLKRDEKLTLLENGGVDNWEWYEESLKEFED